MRANSRFIIIFFWRQFSATRNTNEGHAQISTDCDFRELDFRNLLEFEFFEKLRS